MSLYLGGGGSEWGGLIIWCFLCFKVDEDEPMTGGSFKWGGGVL